MQAILPMMELESVHARAPNDVWVAGSGGGIVAHWDGAQWTIYDMPTVVNIRAAWAASASEVWAVGGGGVILRRQ